MNLPNLALLCAVLISSELVLNLAKRSRERGADKDRLTLPLLWLVISVSIWLAFELRRSPARGPSSASTPLLHHRTDYLRDWVGHSLGFDHVSRAFFHRQCRDRARPRINHDRALSFCPSSFLHGHVFYFPRVRSLPAQHLGDDRASSAGLGGLSLANASGGNCPPRGFWRTLSHLRRADMASPAAALLARAGRPVLYSLGAPNSPNCHTSVISL